MTVEGEEFVVAGPGHSVKNGETTYANIKLDKPNDLIKIQVDACRLTHSAGLGERLAYDFIGGDSNKNNCPDLYTSAKLILPPISSECTDTDGSCYDGYEKVNSFVGSTMMKGSPAPTRTNAWMFMPKKSVIPTWPVVAILWEHTNVTVLQVDTLIVPILV